MGLTPPMNARASVAFSNHGSTIGAFENAQCQTVGTWKMSLSAKPMTKATAAALMPIAVVSRADRHQATGDQRLLIAPTQKNVAPAAMTHAASPPAER